MNVRTDEPELRFAPGVTLHTPTGGALVVQDARPHGRRLLVHFAGVDTRAEAEALRGVHLLADVDAAALPAEPDTYYDRHLYGCTVQTQDAVVVGTVVGVVHLPENDLLEVSGSATKDVLLVPFVASIVVDVDVGARRLVISPPEGLLELAEAN